MADFSLQHAGDTNAGSKRDHNEDCIAAEPQLGLWLVADGMGLGVTEVESTQALALAGSVGRYELLVVDTVVPGPAGLDLARQLKAPRTLLVAGYEPDADTISALAAEEATMLRKPFSTRALKEAVAEALEMPAITDYETMD